MSCASRGNTQAAERWNTVTSAASLAISGNTCAALAPVPIIATRRPFKFCAWSHSAVWKRAPANVSMPSIFARFGRCNPPSPLTTRSAMYSLPSSVCTCQRVPSCTTRTTVQRRRILSRSPYVSTQRSQ